MKHEKTVKALIEKHRAIFPSYSLEQLNAIFAHCETYAGWLEELKAGPAEAEGVKGKAGAELARLEAETAHFESLYFRFFPSPEALFQTEIQLDEEGRESIRQRKVTPPYEGLFKWVKFRNAVYRDFILSLFPEAGEGQPGQPEGQPFGEELERVVRAALEKRRLLNANGHFAGDYTQVKALFVVLRQREYLPKKSKIRAAEILAALFASQFNFDFSPRTVTSAEKEKNAGQDREETRFLGAIPARK